jgi:hypothetical protein
MRALNEGSEANECLDSLADARALQARLAHDASAVAIPTSLIEDARAYLAETIEVAMCAVVERQPDGDERREHIELAAELVPALCALAGGSWTRLRV